jgi:hypothetical protein
MGIRLVPRWQVALDDGEQCLGARRNLAIARSGQTLALSGGDPKTSRLSQECHANPGKRWQIVNKR